MSGSWGRTRNSRKAPRLRMTLDQSLRASVLRGRLGRRVEPPDEPRAEVPPDVAARGLVGRLAEHHARRVIQVPAPLVAVQHDDAIAHPAQDGQQIPGLRRVVVLPRNRARLGHDQALLDPLFMVTPPLDAHAYPRRCVVIAAPGLAFDEVAAAAVAGGEVPAGHRLLPGEELDRVGAVGMEVAEEAVLPAAEREERHRAPRRRCSPRPSRPGRHGGTGGPRRRPR